MRKAKFSATSPTANSQQAMQLVSLKTRLIHQCAKKLTANCQPPTSLQPWGNQPFKNPTANNQHANAACLVENEANQPKR
jgi:hypothetical protein